MSIRPVFIDYLLRSYHRLGIVPTMQLTHDIKHIRQVEGETINIDLLVGLSTAAVPVGFSAKTIARPLQKDD